MHRSMQTYTSGEFEGKNTMNLSCSMADLDSWIDVQSEDTRVIPPPPMISSFADRDLTSSMLINENLLLEAQKESSRVGSKSSRSDR